MQSYLDLLLTPNPDIRGGWPGLVIFLEDGQSFVDLREVIRV